MHTVNLTGVFPACALLCSTSTVTKAPSTAVKELSADEIITSIKYGMIAKSAYYDTDREVRRVA